MAGPEVVLVLVIYEVTEGQRRHRTAVMFGLLRTLVISLQSRKGFLGMGWEVCGGG